MNNNEVKQIELFDETRYRKGVGIILLNKKKEIFLGKRILKKCPWYSDESSNSVYKKQGIWQMPQGGIDRGESVIQASLRELYEETGAKTVRILGVSHNWYYYDFPSQLVPHIWGGQYLGQKQKWVLAQFEGDSSEFNLSIHKEKEFDDWKWASPASALSQVIKFKTALYQKVLQAFCLI